jgi:hypothetical protein
LKLFNVKNIEMRLVKYLVAMTVSKWWWFAVEAAVKAWLDLATLFGSGSGSFSHTH